MKKPPIGITPRWLVTEQRVIDLREAIDRYKLAGLNPLKEWEIELLELECWLKIHELNQKQH